jgi:anti-anti-sigma regulatory factor
MNTAPAKMWVLAGERFACIKICGRANFSSSIDFKTLVQELQQKGYTYFVLELSECTLMDSTFLGVLAGFGLQSTSTRPDRTNITLELLNPNERVTELLESLGVLQLFKLAQGSLPEAADGTQTMPLAPCCPTKEEVTRACLEAHQTLIQVSPQNAAKFKEVATFLAEDLKKVKPGP